MWRCCIGPRADTSRAATTARSGHAPRRSVDDGRAQQVRVVPRGTQHGRRAAAADLTQGSWAGGAKERYASCAVWRGSWPSALRTPPCMAAGGEGCPIRRSHCTKPLPGTRARGWCPFAPTMNTASSSYRSSMWSPAADEETCGGCENLRKKELR